MHHPFKARPVSGEIMTDVAAPTVRLSMSARGTLRDIVEAEFETVRPDQDGEVRSTGKNSADIPAGIGFLKTAIEQDRPASGRGGLAFWTMGAILVIMAFFLGGGSALIGEVRSGLAIGDRQADGFHTASVASPETGVDGQAGGMEHHFLGTSADHMKAQGSFVFSGSLELPKDGERSVSIAYGEED